MDENTLRRIRKLLAIAEDSRGDPNECAAAARMAESIMRKYQIEHADVISAELQSPDAFGEELVGSTLDPEGASKTSAGWAGVLAVHVANLYDAQVRYAWTPRHGKTLKFSGYKVDVEVARQTYVFIVNNMAAASRAYLRENRWAGRREAESFRSGYIAGVGRSIEAIVKEKAAEMQQAASSRALVLAKDRAVAERFGEIKYRSYRQGRRHQADAFTSGRDAGSRLDVARRGLTGASSGTQRIKA